MNDKKIVPVNILGLDCFTNTVLTLINYRYGEYQKVLWDSWLFVYNEKEKSISKKVKIPSNIYIQNAYKYYGIKVIKEQVDRNNLVGDISYYIKKNGPVMVCIDTFYCEWYENYSKEHSKHIFIVERYEDGFFYIYDTMPIRVNIKMSSKKLVQGFIWMKFVLFQRIPYSDSVKLTSFLDYTVNRKRSNHEIESLKDFVEDLSYENLYMEVDKPGYVWSIPILNYIRRIFGSREHFLDVIDYIYSTSNDARCIEVKENFKEVIRLWGKITHTLYKFYFKKNDKKLCDRIINYLAEVLKEENRMITYLVEHSNEPSITKKMNNYQILLPLNFSSHIFEDKDFIKKTPLQCGVRWNCENLSFMFPEMESNNCMTCNEQRLVVKKENVKKIHFIGYSVWGDQVDDLVFHMSNGDTIKKEISLSDWCTGAIFAENNIWEGEFVEKESNIVYKGGIYDFVIEFDFKANIESIVMPCNEHIILFSIVVQILEEES